VIHLAGAVLLLALNRADSGAISFPAYARQIHTVRAEVDSLAAAGTAWPRSVARVKQELGSLRDVRLPDGRTLESGTPELATQLQPGDVGALRYVAGALDALDRELRSARTEPASASDLAALDAVLRDPRFHPATTPWQRALTWIADRLQSIHLPGLPSAGTGAGQLVWGVAILFLLALLVLGLTLLRGALARLAPAPFMRRGSAPQLELEGARLEARRLATAGSFREALHYLLLATVLALQEQSGVALRPGLTNREYLQHLRQAGHPVDSLTHLKALIDTFDRVWYGHQALSEDGYRACEAEAREALEMPRRAA
jgi:hypothetical protein